MAFTINNYYGKRTSTCGYCKGCECSVAHGMHAYCMRPQDYQDLIDRGWRRSGHYCYKPHNQSTCCPSYTIKCDALEFKLSKSHKKVLKRMNRFLRDGKKDKNEETGTETIGVDYDAGGSGIRDEPQEPNIPIPDVNWKNVAAANPERHAAACKENEHFDDQQRGITQAVMMEKSEGIQMGMGDQASSSGASLPGSRKSFDGINPPCKKAKQIRLERRRAKFAAKGIAEDTFNATKMAKPNRNPDKTLSEYFAECSPSDKHNLKIVLVPSTNKNYTEEAFNLYRKYQLLRHNDNPTPTGLQRFCYESPLQHTKIHDGPSASYGSFHQQYWLDDQLIAVAVIDILPYCVSSVYFFYDPDYSFLSLGTYASLREIEFVQQLAKTFPALKYYYMGFYIHSCQKMRYKGKLVPSYLLCPETYTWNLLTGDTRAKLNEHKYQRFNPDATARDADEFVESNLDSVLLLVENNTCITYRRYIQSFNIETIDNMLDIARSRIYKKITGEDDDRELILEYGKLVGKSCALRMLYLIVN